VKSKFLSIRLAHGIYTPGRNCRAESLSPLHHRVRPPHQSSTTAARTPAPHSAPRVLHERVHHSCRDGHEFCTALHERCPSIPPVLHTRPTTPAQHSTSAARTVHHSCMCEQEPEESRARVLQAPHCTRRVSLQRCTESQRLTHARRRARHSPPTTRPASAVVAARPRPGKSASGQACRSVGHVCSHGRIQSPGAAQYRRPLPGWLCRTAYQTVR
jgi:hypothetical protein